MYRRSFCLSSPYLLDCGLESLCVCFYILAPIGFCSAELLAQREAMEASVKFQSLVDPTAPESAVVTSAKLTIIAAATTKLEAEAIASMKCGGAQKKKTIAEAMRAFANTTGCVSPVDHVLPALYHILKPTVVGTATSSTSK
jgi:hypothetical protein